MTDTITVGRRKVPFSHPDKALFTNPEITKRRLAEHYENVAEAMLPLVRDRPLALQAFPNGIDDKGFFMKSVPRYFPEWIKTVTVPKKGGTLTQVEAGDAATLVYLAGQNVVDRRTVEDGGEPAFGMHRRLFRHVQHGSCCGGGHRRM